MINRHSTDAEIRTELIESGLSANDGLVADVRNRLTDKRVDVAKQWVGTHRIVRTTANPR